MKIVDAWVEDPLLDNEMGDPVLAVETEAQPQITIDPYVTDDGWTVSKYGVIVNYECSSIESPSASDFNVRFAGHLPPIIDVRLFVKNSDELVGHYALTVEKARTMLRRFDADWHLRLADRTALMGRYMWLPIDTKATCRYWVQTKNEPCGGKVSSLRMVSGVQMPLCNHHAAWYAQSRAAKRTA